LNWRHLRKQGLFTISLVLAGGVLLSMLTPNLDLRGALVLIAVLALCLGWVV
jgi:hypothetical protein